MTEQLSRRDQFAVAALQGLLAAAGEPLLKAYQSAVSNPGNLNRVSNFDVELSDLAELAFKIADCMTGDEAGD